MGNNSNKLRRKKVLVCLVGGYKHAIMIAVITITNVFDIKQKSDALVSIF